MNRIKVMTTALGQAYPGIVFGFERLSPSHRNHHVNLRLSWQGGPRVDAVDTHLRQAVPDALKSQSTRGYRGFKVGYSREPTRAELDAAAAEWAAGCAKREADEIERKAKAKRDGIAARAKSLDAKKALIAKLAELLPGVGFKVARAPRGYLMVSWTGGPSEKEVCRLAGLRDHHVERAPDAAEIAAAQALAAKAAQREARAAESAQRKFKALKRMKLAEGIDPTDFAKVRAAYRDAMRAKLLRKQAHWLRRHRLFAPCAQREVTPDRRLRRQRRQGQREDRARQLCFDFPWCGVLLAAIPLTRCKPRSRR